MIIFLKNKNLFVWTGTLFLFVFLLSPVALFAQGATDYVPLSPIPGVFDCETVDADTGHCITGGVTSPESYIKNWVQLGIGLAAVFAVIMIVVGGVQYVMSSAFDSKSDAKKRIWAAIGGLILALGAWLILFTINPDLLNIRLPKNLGSGTVQKTFSPFLDGEGSGGASTPALRNPLTDAGCVTDTCVIARNEEAGEQYECQKRSGGSTEFDAVSIKANGTEEPLNNASSGSGLTAQECVDLIRKGEACGNAGECTYEDWSYAYDFQADIANQIGTASEPLQELLSCMGTALPAGVGQISSISHKTIASGDNSFETCTTTGTCEHSAGSCHFGGSTASQCFGSSYAVDFGDGENKDSIVSAATSCADSSPQDLFIFHASHVHVSLGEENECGCK